eukprot:365325-Chlamydomonas_euryale.AAC.43
MAPTAHGGSRVMRPIFAAALLRCRRAVPTAQAASQRAGRLSSTAARAAVASKCRRPALRHAAKRCTVRSDVVDGLQIAPVGRTNSERASQVASLPAGLQVSSVLRPPAVAPHPSLATLRT